MTIPAAPAATNRVREARGTGRYVRRVRRREEREAAEAALLERLDSIERRLADVEDTVAAALDPSRLDDLAERVDDLAMTSTTHDDLLGVRMHSARLAAELTRSVTELRADLDRLSGREDSGAAAHTHAHRHAG